ncbi:hypothetical protein LOK49_LG08G00857, partial [Camellia lanceoleosa]
RHKRSHRRRRDEKRRSDGCSRRDKEEKKRERRDRERKHRKSRREGKGKVSNGESEREREFADSKSRIEPKGVVRYILKEFPGVASDLVQLLQMIDDGQAVDISGLSERSLVKHLKKLFLSLNLEENGNLLFLLPPNVHPTLEIVGPIIHPRMDSKGQPDHLASTKDTHSLQLDVECSRQNVDDNMAMPMPMLCPNENVDAPRMRQLFIFDIVFWHDLLKYKIFVALVVIGPEMPSAELLAAAAKLTEVEAELREAEVVDDNEVFIGPPPPAVITEAESANEAERFEQVTRIMGVEVESPYDVLGVNRNISADNMKRR